MTQDTMSNSSSRSSFSGTRFNLDRFLSTMQSLKGHFKGEVCWSSNIHSNDNWKRGHCEITEAGSLRRCSETDDESDLVEHLQNCKVKFIEEYNGGFPIIQVSVNTIKLYLKVQDASTFEELICAFMWWSGLRKNGIFEKFVPQKPFLGHEDDAANVLVSKLYVFGPILNKTVPVVKTMDKPNYLPRSEIEQGWFPAMGVLKSNGMLDLLLQQDGTLIYSLNISVLLRSEIRIPDSSLDNENYLFLGVMPNLRQELKITKDQQFIRDCKYIHNSGVILKFPLKIDVEDWFVALKSFAISENFSLNGADKSNHVRVSNSFSISILEGHFNEQAFNGDIPSLYIELSMWGYILSRTPIVKQSYSPFWREIFSFHESLPVNDLKLKVRKKSFNDRVADETIGYINLSQENINDPKLVKESRLPVISSIGKNKQIGTLCVKMTSSLILVLPSSNFTRMDKLLQKVDPEELCLLIEDFSNGMDVKIINISDVFLDIFQVFGRENAWFSALLKRELSTVDNSIARNTVHNKTSSHIYSTLFRGNSVLTLSLEKYFYRVGHEYLEKSICGILRDIIEKQISCELDPARIEEPNPELAQETADRNRKTLYQYVERLWDRIYTTSNDLPMGIREQMKLFRKRLELICMDEGFNTTLNCVSGVLFLRFFCPVILNPKLFNLVSQHLDETSRRTLTLICKILLNLSNLTYFGNKEPFMIGMNGFIESHKNDLLDYIDKVTLKKIDFSPKLLKLAGAVARPNLTMNKEELRELPVIPYLIDKNLRETEIFTFLASLTIKKEGNSHLLRKVKPGPDDMICDRPVMGQKLMIRGLEFEKITENNTEIFGSDLLKYLEEDETLTPDDNGPRDNTNLDNDVIGQLKQESVLLYHKIGNLTQMLTDYEYPSEVILTQPNYSEFLADNIYYSKDKRLFTILRGDLEDLKGLKKLYDFQTKKSALFDNIIPKGNSRHFAAEGIPPHASLSHSSSSLTRNITKLKSKRLPKIMPTSEDNKNKDKSTGKLKRLFKKS